MDANDPFADIPTKKDSADPFADIPVSSAAQPSAPLRRPASISGAMRRMQEPGFVPPKTEQAYPPLSQQYIDLAKATGAQIAGMATGAGELVPGEFGRQSAAGSRQLENIITEAERRSPGAKTASMVASMAVPLGLGGKFISSATTPLKAMGRAGLVGAGYGAVSPTGEEEYLGRAKSKALPVALGTVLGATPATASVAGKALDIAKTATGKRAKSLAETLKTELGGKTEDVIRAAQAAQIEPGKKLEAVGKAQQQLGSREPIAAARQSARENNVDKALSSLSGKTNVLAEDVGAVIQPEAKKNIDVLKKERQKEAITELKDPAFTDARAREARGDFIATNKESAQKYNEVMQEINQQIERTPEPYGSELRKRLASISGREVPLTEAETRAAQVRSSITGQPVPTTKIEPLTLDQAEFMRRLLKGKDLKEGFPALDAQRMEQLGDKLGEAMKKYEPRIDDYIKKYREKSAPITRALAGRGKALTDVELKEAENLLFAADKQAAARYYLDGSQERAQALLAVAGGKKPEIVNTIKGYFRSELQGMNAKQAEAFLQKQEGFLREFPELRKPLKDVVDAKRIAETAGVSAEKRAGAAATRLSGEAKTAEAALTPQAKIEDKYKILKNKLETVSVENTSTEAKSIANSLRQDNLIDDAAHKKLLNQIEMIKNAYGETAEAKKKVLSALGVLGIGFFGKSLID
jgi:hypothetical protein